MKDKGDANFHHIDKYHLDEEWVKQPKLYRQYAEELADAERDHRLAETDLELIEAEVELAIRRDTVAAGLEKGTEGEIKKAVVVDKRVRKAKHAVITARHTVDVLKAMVRTLEHKKAGIQDLTQLSIAAYYADPQVKSSAARAMQESQMDRAFGKKRSREED